MECVCLCVKVYHCLIENVGVYMIPVCNLLVCRELGDVY